MNSTVSSCPFVGSPPLNSDIAGVGVRISTYVQAFLAIVAIAISPSLEKLCARVLPSIMMNISIIVAALVLSSNPQISLQDATIAWFFTVIPFVILGIACKKLQDRNDLEDTDTSAWDSIANIVFTAIMIILSAAFTLAVFSRHKTFGTHPECNNRDTANTAKLLFFGTHTVSHG